MNWILNSKSEFLEKRKCIGLVRGRKICMVFTLVNSCSTNCTVLWPNWMVEKSCKIESAKTQWWHIIGPFWISVCGKWLWQQHYGRFCDFVSKKYFHIKPMAWFNFVLKTVFQGHFCTTLWLSIIEFKFISNSVRLSSYSQVR